MDIKEKLFREDYLFTREDILKSLPIIQQVRQKKKRSFLKNQ